MHLFKELNIWIQILLLGNIIRENYKTDLRPESQLV